MKTSDLANKRELVRALLKQQGVSLCDKPGIQRRANSDVYPLSFAQQRLWFLDRFDASTPAYNISLATRLDGPLDLSALSSAFQEITRRHEVLRSTFVPFEGQAIQLIAEPSNEPIPVVDLSTLPVETRDRTRRLIVHDLAQTTFDLSHGPLVNLTVLKLAPAQHVISLTMHHIVSDGWSADILMRELTTLYGAYVSGKPSPLPELPIQYADFAHWQREWLSGETLDNQLQYWRKQLAGAPLLPQLPTDRVRPAVQTFRGARVHQEWNEELRQQLKNLSQQEGVTMFMTLLAAFQLLLARWSGQEEVVVGAPIAGRHHVETEPLIGCFINTLLMRTSMSGNPSVRELLQRVREMCLQAYAHQDVPFEKLVEELQPERNLSHTPLFQVLFLMQYAGKETGSSNALALVPLKADTDTAKFDLTLLIEDGETGLVCGIEYNTDLFDAATVQRMLGHYGTLLEGFVNDPARPISELSLLTPAERELVIGDWNRTVKDYGPQLSLHRSFEIQAERTPNAVALVFENERLTYAELNRLANQLAHHLLARGVKTESRVGVMLERSMEMVISLYAIVKAGAAYVPMDPEYPQERLAFMLADSAVDVLLTETRLQEGLVLPCAAICLDSEWENIAGCSGENPGIALTGDNLAYMIYTSGSTGKPKGAMNSHAAIFNRLSWMQEAYRLTPADRVLQKTPFSFDVSVWEFFWPLMTGARLVVARPGGHRDSAYLAELIRRERITTLHFVPPMLQVFLAEDDIEACASLRRVICSGEALSRELQDRFFARLPRVELHNLYGPTEAAVDVTWWACDPAANQTSVPIGKPIANTQIYLLDQYLHPVPAGVPGELYIGGVQLARGYHHRPSLTAEKFVPDPFSDVPGARLYRTGDLARHLADGSIEYLGRLDFQVKIRGFRIELGEIEAALMSHPAIREAVVIAREDGQDKRLVAYLLPENERVPGNSELREALKEQLPDYMAPAQFVTVDAWPLSPNGKVDRRALPAPGRQHTTEELAYIGPRTPAEEVLVSIWEQVLGLEQIGINDNFFGLGGDSIRSLQVLSLAKNRGLNFNLQQLFKYQTVRDLAGSLYTNTNGKQRRRVEPFELVPLADRERLPEGLQDAYPLAKLQGGMLYHMELRPEDPLYHNVDSMLLRVRFDAGVLEEAVARIVERHPMLRTSFALSGFSEALQFVHHEALLPIGVDDIRDLSPDEQEQRIDEFILAEKLRPFALDRPPMLRFHVHRRSEETFQFTLTECHAIQDGWSLHTMLTEIFSYYLAKLKGDDVPEWEDLPINYRDFVQLEREALASKECADYWEQKLEDCTITMLPRWNGTEKAATSARVKFHPVEIDREVSEALKELARATATPLKSVLLAAHLKVMSLASGETDVLTGVASNGRLEETGGERVVGLFLNTLPFRLQLPEGSWSELVKATFANEWELLPYRRYPMAAVQNSKGQKLYETAFNFIHFHVVESVLRTGDVAVLAAKTAEATSWVLQAHFSLGIGTLQVELQVEYDSMFLSEEQIAALTGHYANVLQAMARNPHENHNERQFLSEVEAERLQMHRQTAPPPKKSRAEPETVYVAPRTDMERLIAEIWKEVLRVDKVGLHDNFFDLGGHSLRMIEVTRRLQTTLNRVLPVMDMFEYPTVSA
ncbi:MAG TPA: amino acid adenylation domain-containing protein, partial [Pyrinomonadaceae bacterium]|nr:amino acid adenylation domain-containing protein [Pyrinomonadaceae bacterium]